MCYSACPHRTGPTAVYSSRLKPLARRSAHVKYVNVYDPRHHSALQWFSGRKSISRDVSKRTFNPQFIHDQIPMYSWDPSSVQLVFYMLHLIRFQCLPICKYKLVLYITRQLLAWSDLRETSCKHRLFQAPSLQSACPGSRVKKEQHLYTVFRINPLVFCTWL